MEFNADVFSKFDKEWALVCAGNKDHYNAMTISWGGFGTLWFKPVVTVTLISLWRKAGILR